MPQVLQWLERSCCVGEPCEHGCSLACGVAGCSLNPPTETEHELGNVSEDALCFPVLGVYGVHGRETGTNDLSAVLMTRCSDFLSARVILPYHTVMPVVRTLSTTPLWTCVRGWCLSLAFFSILIKCSLWCALFTVVTVFFSQLRHSQGTGTCGSSPKVQNEFLHNLHTTYWSIQILIWFTTIQIKSHKKGVSPSASHQLLS